MQDNELFELCREVYKRTQWSDTDAYFLGKEIIHRVPRLSDLHPPTLTPDDCSPLYTSDYLLEKIPNMIRVKRTDMQYPVRFAFKLRTPISGKPNWRAGYYNTPRKQELKGLGIEAMANTPLKALLKLTIALHEAGELK